MGHGERSQRGARPTDRMGGETKWEEHAKAKGKSSGKGGKGERDRGKGTETVDEEEKDVFAMIRANQKLTLSLQ